MTTSGETYDAVVIGADGPTVLTQTPSTSEAVHV